MSGKIKHNGSKEKLYDVWIEMKRRCRCKTHKNYKHYGARGISVSNLWNEYLPFKKWALENGYKIGLSIDRINNDGNYDPDNCRFTTQKIQVRNTRLLSITNKSGYRGVHFDKNRKTFVARVSVNNKTVYIGSSDNKKEAAIMRDVYVIKNNMEHTLNFKKEVVYVK